VSYYFPPAGGVAATRVGKLAKYLGRSGWAVRALTAPTRGRVDSSLAADVSEVKVVEVRESHALPSLHGAAWTAALLPILRREARRSDVVLVSGAPFLPLLGASVACGRTPYVADLRDLWAAEPRFGRATRGGARRLVVQRAERLAEAFSLRRAASVLTVAPELAEMLARDHPRLARQVTVVPHGFDPDDFSQPLQNGAGRTQPVLLHAGTMMADERTPALIVETARRVRSAGVPLSVHLLGNFDPRLNQLVDGPIAAGWLTLEAAVDHRLAVSRARAADLLWLEPGPYDFAITGKVYEYLAANVPLIVAARPTNAAARLVAQTGGGIIAGEHPADCANAVLSALAGNTPLHHKSVLNSYSLPSIVERLDDLLERAI
jgi:glycosyltransferase involved in cell wall biosynthesis